MIRKRFTMCHEQNDINGWTMSIVDWETKEPFNYTTYEVHSSSITDTKDEMEDLCLLLNELNDENKKLKQDLKNCKKLAGKRLNKNRNHRAVIEDLGGSIRAYKGQISQLNEKIEKIQEAMEDTGALTKRQLEEILND